MPEMNKDQVLTRTHAWLSEYAHMFADFNRRQLETFKPSVYGPVDQMNIENAVKFAWPRDIRPRNTDGFRLSGNKGYISILEVYKQSSRGSLDMALYVYRYMTDEYTMRWARTADGTSMDYDSFCFHYDKDPRHADNPHHLQVVNAFPRFPTHLITIQEFLRTIDSFCFEDQTPVSGAIFANRV